LNLKKIVAFSFGPLGSAVIALITLPVIAWFFTPYDIGRLSMFQVVISFTLLAFTLGLDEAFVREFHEESNKSELLKSSFIPGFILLISVLCGFIIGPWSLSVLLFNIDSGFVNLILYTAIIFSYISRYLSLILRLEERGVAYSLSQLLPKFIFLLIIFAIVFGGFGINFENLILANLLSITCVMIIYTYNTKNIWLKSFNSNINTKKLNKMLSYSIPLVGSGIAFWGLTAIDKVFLRSLSGFTELGIYSLTISLAGGALLFQTIFSTIWMPLIYRWFANGNLDPLMIRRVIDFVSVIVFIIWSLIGIFSWVFVYILPNDYIPVHYIILSAISYPLLYTLADASSVGIGIMRKSLYVLLATFSSLLINILANWILIPIYGASGAAIASNIAFLFYFVIVTEASSIVWMKFKHVKLYSLVLIFSLAASLFNIFSGVEYYFIVLIYAVLFSLIICLYKEQISEIKIYITDKSKLWLRQLPGQR
jgi:O-antigen/teichoic acid export membrane protein